MVLKMDTSELPAFLRAQIKERKIRKGKLAEQMGITPQHLRRVMAGEAPTKTVVKALKSIGFEVQLYAEVKKVAG